jgi:hypothetical protein
LTEDIPKLNFEQIDFPTDHLTVRDIRQEWYRATSRAQITTSFVKGLEDIIQTERELAEGAFYDALGIEPPADLYGVFGGVDGTREVLALEYERRGIASGQHAAELLVSSIETQAAAQAAKLLGRRPG